MKNKKIRVLYILSTLRLSGPVNVLFNLIKYLDRNRFEPIILTLSPEPQNSKLSDFQKLGVDFISLNLSRLQGLTQAKSKLIHVVKELSPEVIHSHGIRPDLLSSKYLQSYKQVTTIHNYPDFDYRLKYGNILGKYMAYKHINAFKKIDFPVAICKRLATYIGINDIQSKVIYNGVDFSYFNPSIANEKLSLRQKLNLPADKNIFISVGQLSARKDPITLIRGFLSSDAKNNGILLLLGDGELKQECQKLCHRKNSIQFMNEVNNVYDYVKSADYFISASLSEGLGYAVLEALACGIPVCLSEIEAHQEILNYDNNAGSFFPVGDHQSLANVLNGFIRSDNYEQQSSAAVEIVSKYFNAELMAAQYQKLYLINPE